MKKHLSLAITLLTIAVFFVYFLSNTDDFKKLLEIGAGALISISLLRVFGFIVNGLFLKWTTEVFVKHMKFSESLYITVISSVGNYFGPLLGGVAVRGVYLKKRFNLSYSTFTSTIAGYYLIIFAINSLLGLLALLVLGRYDTEFFVLMAFFGAWFTLMIAMMFLRLPKKFVNGIKEYKEKKQIRFRVAHSVIEVEQGWRRLLSEKGLLFKLIILAVSSYALTLITTLIEFRVLGIELSFSGAMIYTSLVISSLLINLTPGAIGIRETIILASSGLLGISSSEVLQVSLLDRTVAYAVLGFSYVIMRLYKQQRKH